jgi:bifunctional dethiobiotin synthetase / adenosylmethionine---8-amino-7-oxononanoate aminotransferase
LIQSTFSFIDPLYQKILIQECKLLQIPIVLDEIAVGMYRLGPVTTMDILKETADIACYGKMLSGGYVSLAVTLATEEVFHSYHKNDDTKSPLMHGHSYTANPIACAAAMETIRLLETNNRALCIRHSKENHPWMADAFEDDDILQISQLPGVKSATSMGSVLSIKLLTSRNKDAALNVIRIMRTERVFARPLGSDTIYLMVTPYSEEYDKLRLIRVLRRSLTKAYYTRMDEEDEHGNTPPPLTSSPFDIV